MGAQTRKTTAAAAATKQKAQPYVKEKTKKTALDPKILDGLKTHLASLPCATCHTTGTLVYAKDTNTEFDPPAPMFECTKCNSHMYHGKLVPALMLLKKQATNNSNQNTTAMIDVTPTPTTNIEPNTAVTPPIDYHTSTETPAWILDINKRLDAHDQLLNDFNDFRAEMQKLVEQNVALQKRVKELERENAMLRSKHDPDYGGTAASKHAPTQQPTNTQPPAATTTPASRTTPPPKSSPKSTWADKARVVANRKPTPSRKAIAAVARHFQPTTDSQGYKFVYIPLRHYMTTSKLRHYLRTLRIENARVLDIHFPQRLLAALLVHNDYADDLEQALTKKGIPTKNYNPLDTANLVDPKWREDHVTEEDRKEQCRLLRQQKLTKALTFIREPVKFSVARYFFTKNMISKADYEKFSPPPRPKTQAQQEKAALHALGAAVSTPENNANNDNDHDNNAMDEDTTPPSESTSPATNTNIDNQ
ncbi:hypothetical protein O0I10_013155 [Lichtheimia ornata]|uniref:Uncharacterized protein n=1 Tax=Lichtheimia ornata TaxID=688661 RepID=A0AAD7URJ0_9FUNG|nr:uncharacterized protein O0I10_013155 [Lichtheimia ornata]KAJ8651344.1 hypothetical protein O0I10_013155 [Lichtheimia ornata]